MGNNNKVASGKKKSPLFTFIEQLESRWVLTVTPAGVTLSPIADVQRTSHPAIEASIRYAIGVMPVDAFGDELDVRSSNGKAYRSGVIRYSGEWGKTPVDVTYGIIGDRGFVDDLDNGILDVAVRSGQLRGSDPSTAAGGKIGTAKIAIPTAEHLAFINQALLLPGTVEGTAIDAEGRTLVVLTETNSRVIENSDGSVTVVQEPRMVVRRINTDGTVDTDFGVSNTPGAVRGPSVPGGSSGQAVVVDKRNSRILVAVSEMKDGVMGLTIRAFKFDGTPDQNWGDGSIHTDVAFDGTDKNGNYFFYAIESRAMLLLDNGELAVAGYTETPTGKRHAFIELIRPDGRSRVENFGQGGQVVMPMGGQHEEAGALTYDPATDTFAVAIVSDGDVFLVCVRRRDGKPDGTFGEGAGKVRVKAIASPNDRSNVALNAIEGGYLVGASTPDGSKFAVAKIRNDGTPVAGFGASGVTTVDAGGQLADVDRLVLSGRRIYATGAVYDQTGASAGVAAINIETGSLETDYGIDGVALFDRQAYPAPEGKLGLALHAGTLVLRVFLYQRSLSEQLKLSLIAAFQNGSALRDLISNDALGAKLVSTSSVKASGDVASVTIRFKGVHTSTIKASNLSANRPDGEVLVPTDVNTSVDGAVTIVTYILGDIWSPAQNGIYIVSLKDELTDRNGNILGGAVLGQISVSVGGTTEPPPPPPGPIAAAHLAVPPKLAGGKGRFGVTLISGPAAYRGAITIDLYFSADHSWSQDDRFLNTKTKAIAIKANATKRINVNARILTETDGQSYVLAVVRADGRLSTVGAATLPVFAARTRQGGGKGKTDALTSLDNNMVVPLALKDVKENQPLSPDSRSPFAVGRVIDDELLDEDRRAIGLL